MQKVSLNKDSCNINLAGFMDVMTHDDSRLHQKAGGARLSDALSNLNVRGQMFNMTCICMLSCCL